jgi:MFS family permease
MGLISVAIGLGTVIWIPVSTHLVEEFGWRSAYRILGVAIAVISLPLIAFLIRSAPAALGLAMEGENDPSNENGSSSPDAHDAAASNETGFTLRKAFRTPSFWLIACATFFVAVPSSGFGLHLIAFLRDSDMSATRAGLVWSFTMGVSIAGRFFFGWISERYQKRYFAGVANSIRALTLLLMVLFALKMLPVAVAVIQLALLYGLGNGCNAVMNPLIVGETFGVKSFGKIMGVLGIPFTAGMALGQVAGGRLYVMMGNYNAVFSIFAILFVCAGISISLAKPLFLLETRAELNSDTG